MANTYDFYKPKLDSEYPEVDGPVSVVTYVSALDQSYARYKEKVVKAAKRAQANGTNGVQKHAFSLNDIDYAIFHAPYGKQVQKGYGRMLYNDFLSNPSASEFANVVEPENILSATYKASLTDKNIEKTFIAASKPTYAKKVSASMHCSNRCGNMYTASLYGCLASLLSAVEPAELLNKRVSMFAFGSGYASSFFTLRVTGDTSEIREKMDLLNRLQAIKVVPCQEYVDALGVSNIFSTCELISDCFLLAAPGEEPHRGFVHTLGLRGQHLAERLLPRECRCQIQAQVRAGAQGLSECICLFCIEYPWIRYAYYLLSP